MKGRKKMLRNAFVNLTCKETIFLDPRSHHQREEEILFSVVKRYTPIKLTKRRTRNTNHHIKLLAREINLKFKRLSYIYFSMITRDKLWENGFQNIENVFKLQYICL